MAAPDLNSSLGAEHLRNPPLSDDEVYDIDQLRADIEDCSNDEQRGTFAHTGAFSQFENPGLEVSGIGLLGLPLMDTSTFKNAATEVAAQTWEVGVSEVSFQNPRWDAFVQEIVVPLVTAELGVSSAARSTTCAELVKLVLQEQGAESPMDPTNAPEKYGVLEICLPSPHDGGQIILKHDHYQKPWFASDRSSYRVPFAGWYADVDHASQPITSGHRLLLSYDLVDTSGPTIQAAANLSRSDTKLREALQNWTKSMSHRWYADVHCLCWELDNKYPARGLSLASLKGQDARIVAQMSRVGRESDFTVLLAVVHLRARGECEMYDEYEPHEVADFHHMVDVEDEEWRLTHVVDLEGDEKTREVEVSRDLLIQADWFDDEEGDEKVYDTHRYNKYDHHYEGAAMVIVPNGKMTDFRAQPGFDGRYDMGLIVETMMHESQADESNKRLRGELHALISSIETSTELREREMLQKPLPGKPKKTPLFDDDSLGLIAQAALYLRQVNLFDRIIKHVKTSIPLEVYPKYGELTDVNAINEFEASFASLISQHKNVTEKIMAHDGLRKGYLKANTDTPSSRATIDGCSKRLVDKILEDTEPQNGSDGQTMLKFCLERPQKEFFEQIVPWVKKWASRSSFIIAFLACWTRTPPPFAKEELQDAFTDLARHASADLTVATTGPVQKEEPAPVYSYRFDPSANNVTPRGERRIVDHIEANAFANVIRRLTETENQEVAEALLTKFADQAKEPGQQSPHLHHLQTIPLLQALAMERLEGRLESYDNVQTAISHLVVSYLNHFVRREPGPPTNWKKPPLKCTCHLCLPISVFLQNPQQIEHRVSTPEHNRKHIERTDYRDFDCHVERSKRPFVLVITKNRYSEERTHRDWEKRVSTAGQQLAFVGKDTLRELLLPEYKHLVETDEIRESLSLRSSSLDRKPANYTTSSAPVERRPLGERPPRPQGQAPATTIPSKRRAEGPEMVDLTDE